MKFEYLDCLMNCMFFLFVVFEMYDVFVECYIGFDVVSQQVMFDMFGFVLCVVLIDVVILVLICCVEMLLFGLFVQLKSEVEVFVVLCVFVDKNQVFCFYIGQGYYDMYMLVVILCNVFENLVWYMVYMLYQFEIFQGCFEVFLNFQQMVVDFMGFVILNVLLLDEVMVVVEVMMLLQCIGKLKLNVFYVVDDVLL